MPRSRPPYPAEFRRQMVELVQTGRTPGELSREFGVTAQSISAWVAQAAVDSGKPLPGKDVLSTAEREELARLRRQSQAARAGARHPGKGYGLVRRQGRQDVHRVYELVNANQADACVQTMCRVLGVSASGYYDWLRPRSPSARAIADARARRAHPRDPRRVRRHLRHAAGAGRAERPRREHQPQARGSTDAPQRHPRHQPAPRLRRDHPTRRAAAPCARPRQARVRSRWSEPVVGGRHDLRAYLGGLHLPGCRAGRLEPARGGLGHRRGDDLRAGARRTEHGVAAAPAARRHPSQRPRQPVHQHCLRRALQEDGRASIDGHGGRRLRQRDGGELLRHARVRADRPTQAGRPRPRRDSRCSPTSRVGTTRAAGTARSATRHQQRSRRRTLRRCTGTRSASNTGYPPSASAWRAPRRRWISLRRR